MQDFSIVGLPVYFLRPSHSYGIGLCLYLCVYDIMQGHSYVNVSPPCRPTRRAWTRRPVHDHRLNGSSSPVLTATSLSYGKAKNSTPHRIKTPNLIEIKFGTVDYVGETTPYAKFHVNLH